MHFLERDDMNFELQLKESWSYAFCICNSETKGTFELANESWVYQHQTESGASSGRGIKNKLGQPAWFSNFTWGNEGTFALAKQSWLYQKQTESCASGGNSSAQHQTESDNSSVSPALGIAAASFLPCGKI